MTTIAAERSSLGNNVTKRSRTIARELTSPALHSLRVRVDEPRSAGAVVRDARRLRIIDALGQFAQVDRALDAIGLSCSRSQL